MTSNDQVAGDEFCPIAPTPQGAHRLQVHKIYSLNMFADALRLGNSFLRVEAFLIPYDMLSLAVWKLFESEILRDVWPGLQGPSLNELLVI